MSEARRHPRYKMEVDARVYMRNAAVVRGHSVDISESGISAMLGDEVPVGEVVRLVAVPTGDVVIPALTRQRNAFRYGFQFLEAIAQLEIIQRGCRQLAVAQSMTGNLESQQLFPFFRVRFPKACNFFVNTCKKSQRAAVVCYEVQCMKSSFLIFAVCLLACLSAVAQQGQPASPSGDTGAVAESSDRPNASEPSAHSERLDLTPDAQGKLSQEQMQNLFRVVADKDMENDKRQRDYTYIEREVQNNLDGKGNKKSTEIKTYEILEIYGEQVERLISKDDKPLSDKDAAKEEDKIQKVIDKRKNESEEARKKREEKQAKEREDGRKFVQEIADAYNFKLVGTELVGGREAWVIDGEPRPGFEPHMKDAKYLTKFHGRVWIDKDDLQLAKMDLETLDTISFGLVVARLHKGTRITMEQTRVNDEVWLPKHVTFKLSARVALLKGYNIDGEQAYRDYKKFRTSAKIVSIGEIQNPKVTR